MNIITKFIVVTDEGLEALATLAGALAAEQGTQISGDFSRQSLAAEVNSISNQWLVVYVDDQLAGYACITTKGKRPQMLDGKRAIRIRDFGVLEKYAAPAVVASLLDKCLAACKSYEKVWIAEPAGSPLVALLEDRGFVRHPDALPLPLVCLIA
ncbi:N-acetyltransferase [Chitinophaga lutea]